MKHGTKIKKLTKEEVLIEALKYETRSNFYYGNMAAYRFANRHGFLDEACAHMALILTYWDFESIQKEALKYKTRVDFQKKSSKAYNAALRMGIINQVCAHMVKNMTYWTDEMLQSEALLYKTRKEFEIGNCSAYSTAQKRGILDKICNHMVRVLRHWTDEDIHLEALKYNSRIEFIKNSHSAYGIALSRGILDIVCSHMKPSRGSSLAERELMSIIKDIYPNAKKLNDRKVKIEGKSYIKGFQIDILVENLGIEFDGKYHHTFDYMRRDPKKSKWSDDDIRNYHQLKDDWFATKDIQIFHVKEEDWIKDKEACIKKCFDFLIILEKRVA